MVGRKKAIFYVLVCLVVEEAHRGNGLGMTLFRSHVYDDDVRGVLAPVDTGTRTFLQTEVVACCSLLLRCEEVCRGEEGGLEASRCV